jgi:hypothetical protein
MAKGIIIKYSSEELAFIKSKRKLLRKNAYKKFCKKFNRDDVSMINFNALCKRNGWFTGRFGYFEKGSIPFNKGKKQIEYTSKEGIKNSSKTRFKKGQTPHNTKYGGHERFSKDGYIEISVKETNPYTGFERRYVLKHKYLWEKENGKVPEGMCLKCLDGNKQNTDPSNWELIDRTVLPFLIDHRGFNYNEVSDEFKPTVLALAKLKAKKSKM